MTKMSHFARPGRQLMLWAGVTLAIAGSALAQTAGTTAPAASKPPAPASTSDDDGYSKWELTPYFGWQWFQMFQSSNLSQYAHNYESGWIFGERFDWDFDKHFSLEFSGQLGRNKDDLRPWGQTGTIPDITYNTQVASDLMYNFNRRSAKNRVFVMVGPALAVYSAHALSTSPSGTVPYVPPTSPLQRKEEVGIVYGVGLKHYFNRRYGLRFDLDGRVDRQAHYGLPSIETGVNTLYIPRGGADSSLMLSVGFIIREGWVNPTPKVTAVNDTVRVDAPAAPSGAPTVAGAHDVCPGDDLRLTVNANGFTNPTYAWRVNGAAAAGATGAAFSAPTATGTGARAVTAVVSVGPSVSASAPYATTPNHTYHLTADVQGLNGRTAAYQWMMNGQPISGATSSSYDVPDSGAGSVTVQVTVQNPPVTSAPANFTIRPLTPPTLTFAVNPSTVRYTSGPITLAAQATASPCGGPVTLRYSGEGVTGNTFTPGSVSGFDMSNRIRPQTRTVTITATATDAKNQVVTRPVQETVTLDPEARRLDDIIFPNLSSRVNNCGKRLLLEELTPMLRNDPGAKVYLIGHRDEREKGSKTALALDATRALNAAAVLSAGKGICPSLDLSRIMYKAVGADQTDTPRPALCGASTNVKEKSGQAIKDSDKNAEFRRVEVWFIPSGAADPAGVTGMTPLPAAQMAKIGCPK